MKTPNLLPLRLAGLTLGILAALLLWPGTRRLVRQQLAYLAPGRPSAWAWAAGFAGSHDADTEVAAQLGHKIAAAQPQDFEMQLADAVTASNAQSLSATEKVERLRRLGPRFADRPSLVANILRFETQGQVIIERNDERVAFGEQEQNPRSPQPYDPGMLASFDRDAGRGEQLDPDNAYFPMMRAVGLFAAHRDKEALAALHRAAQKTMWAEYYEDEAQGEWRLQELAFGDSNGLSRSVTAAAILVPQYARFRSVARLAVVKAMQAEQAGRNAEGISIREDVLRCGGLMRSESRILIGSLVGSAIAQLALQRPGGAPLLKPAPDSFDAHQRINLMRERLQKLLSAYDLFLQRSGHPEQSARAHAEMDAAVQVREIATMGIERSAFDTQLWQLGLWWWVDLVLLCGALWTIALGGLAALAYGYPRLRTGQGLPRWAGSAMLCGFVAALLGGLVLVSGTDISPWLALVAPLLGGLTMIAFPRADRTERLRALGVYGSSLVVSLSSMCLFAWHVCGTLEPLRKMVVCMFAMYGQSEQHSGFGLSSIVNAGFHLVSVLAAAMMPLLAALVFAAVGRLQHVPVSVALVRGFRGCALPIACYMLLIYALLLPITLRLENAADESVKQMIHHEGRSFAELTGKEWPGIVP